MRRTFAELERAFFRNLDVSDTTKGDQVRAFRQFKKWVVFQGLDVERLERADIVAYKSYLKGSGRSETTMEYYLLVVRLFYRFVEDSGEGSDIAAGIRQRRSKRGYYKEHLTDEEVERLLASIPRERLVDFRDYAIIYLMLSTGLRCVEVARLRKEDLYDVHPYPFLLIQRKGRIRRLERFGVTREILSPILQYLDRRGTDDSCEMLFATHGRGQPRPLAPSAVSVLVRERMKAAGVYSKEKTPHSLRHTAAVRAIKAKVPMREVQVMLGHKRIETTELYLESLNDEMRLQNPAVHALPPLPSQGKERARDGLQAGRQTTEKTVCV